jgi:hypothetical protein
MKYLLYICVFILIILFFSYMNSKPKEPFTSGVRGFYRPIIRRTRLAAEGFYNNTKDRISTNMDSLFTTFGLKR